MSITADQLAILRDMLNECRDDWPMLHIDIQKIDNRKIVIEIDDVNERDVAALFDGQEE